MKGCIAPVTVIALATLASAAATAQPTSEPEPVFGQHTLTLDAMAAGAEPVVLSVLSAAGPTIDLADWRLLDAISGQPCGSATLSEQPTVAVVLPETATPPTELLRLMVEVPADSETDPVLLVREPDGRFRCVDDAPGRAEIPTLLPIVDLVGPEPGTYLVWVGTYHPRHLAPVHLVITTDPTRFPSPEGY
jgi:hypothetical protein